MHTRTTKLAAVAVAAVAGLVLVTGAAFAASGGGSSSDQSDCPWNADAWNAPPNYVPPGCHNVSVNLESGGTTNGDANSNNTRYAEAGVDALPNNGKNPSFGGIWNVGDPGTADSPHSGCLAANTDGTGGGPGTGCGNNPNGAGFSGTFDYYQLYCPLAAILPVANTPDPSGHAPALYQCAAGQPVGTTQVTPDTGTGAALDPILTQGLLLYLGAYDNLDNGEHDGFDGANNTDGAINGPSDGGALTASATPQTAGDTPTASHPEGLGNVSTGFCADGICAEGTTQQQSVYQGCGAQNPQNNSADDQCAPGTPQNDNVYENNAPSSTKEAYGCSSGDANGEQACHTNSDGSANPGGANAYRQGTPSNMNAEPGVQTYQDPDPQRSPAAPFGTPGAYVGTCGVYTNDSGGYGEPGVTGTVTGNDLVPTGYAGGVSNC